MDQESNVSAMAPVERPTTSGLLGDIVRALTEHGFSLEQQVDSLRNGNRALQYAQKHAEAKADHAQQNVYAQAERIASLETLLYETWTLVDSSIPNSELPYESRNAWRERRDELRRQYHEMLPGTQPAQTDAEPTEGVVPTCTKDSHVPLCGHTVGVDDERVLLPPFSEHAPDGGNHPTVPPAG